jgi:PAS domain-containing protein
MDLLIKNNYSLQPGPLPYSQTLRHENTLYSERMDPPALSLDERGMIQDCSKSFERLFGFKRCDLVWQHVSRLLPQLTGVDLVEAGRLNPVLNYLCHCGHRYQAQNQQGDTFPCNLNFVRLEFGGKPSLRLILSPCCGLDS